MPDCRSSPIHGVILSLDGHLRERSRRELRIPEFGPVEIEFATVRKLGGAVRITNPANGDPTYLVQPASGEYGCVSGVCTHRGCTLRPDGTDLRCPCHGAVFTDAGDVVRGPAREPLERFAVLPGPNGQLYLQG